MIWWQLADHGQQLLEGPSSVDSEQEVRLPLLHFDKGTTREGSYPQHLFGF